jgi:hypothetical protein
MVVGAWRLVKSRGSILRVTVGFRVTGDTADYTVGAWYWSRAKRTWIGTWKTERSGPGSFSKTLEITIDPNETLGPTSIWIGVWGDSTLLDYVEIGGGDQYPQTGALLIT